MGLAGVPESAGQVKGPEIAGPVRGPEITDFGLFIILAEGSVFMVLP